MELIAVVMRAPTSAHRFEDAKTLLDYGFASYALAEVYPDAPLAPIPVLLGEQEQAFGIRTLCALAFVSAGIYITNSAASSSGVRS